MTSLYVLVGCALGAAAALVQLALTRWRAEVATAGGVGLFVWTFPVGLVVIAAFLGAAAWVAPVAAWSCALGLVLVRMVAMRRLTRSPP
jgi:hypothetical protein